MALLDLFKEKNPFRNFQKRIDRLQALLSVMEQEAEREHFQQLKGHLKATILLIGSKTSLNQHCLVRLLEEEKEVIRKEPTSQKRQLLEKFETDVEKYLELFLITLGDALRICEYALSSWQNKQLLQNSRIEIEKKIMFLEKAMTDLKKLTKFKSEVYDKLQKETKMEMPNPMQLEGVMSNGWRLSIIQKVIRQLGAYVVPGGKHPYKIIIPWAPRPHTLSKDLDPYGFATSLAKLLGISKERLIESFNRGELVTT